jgi:hypothetical protein
MTEINITEEQFDNFIKAVEDVMHDVQLKKPKNFGLREKKHKLKRKPVAELKRKPVAELQKKSVSQPKQNVKQKFKLR